MSFSAQSFSQFAFGEQDDDAPAELDPTGFEDFLAEITKAREWLLEVSPLSLSVSGDAAGGFSETPFSTVAFGEDDPTESAGGVVTMRFSTRGYISHGSDSPSDTMYDGRLDMPVRVLREMSGQDALGGLIASSAEIALVNEDGQLDNLTRDYAFDGREVRILVGAPDAALSSFGTIFRGVVSATPRITRSEVSLTISDGVSRLNQPVNSTVYAGSGGLEGGADLAGKPKPKGWGEVFNIDPPLVDSAKLIYQVHDGLIEDVTAVYDRGVALARAASDYGSVAELSATAPDPGEYKVLSDASGSYFRLGATPDGTVTSDAQLDADPTYVSRTDSIIMRLINPLGLASDEIDSAAFARLASDAPAEVGIWTGAVVLKIADVVDRLLSNVGAYGGFDRLGRFTVGVVGSPTATADASYDEVDILDIERQPLPSGVDPIVWRARVAYQRNYTVQTDLAASVSDAQRTFAAQEVRFASSESASVLAQHPLARELNVEDGLFVEEADADTEATRRFALWGRYRAPFSVTLRPIALLRNLGHIVYLTHSRFGLSDGASALVLRQEITGTEVTLGVIA